MIRADRRMLPDGVEELLPPRAARAERLRRRLLDLYRSWGYELVMPPLLEFTDSLLVSLGRDVDLLTFKVTDQLSGRALGIRADITPQVARIDAHSLKQDGPVRLCYAGSVLHARPKTPLASRSPIQVGAELYGDAGLASDSEIILLMLETLRVAGLEQITLDLGHVDVYRQLIALAGLNEAAEHEIFDALQRKATADLTTLLAASVPDAQLRGWLAALGDLQGGIAVLEEARQRLAGAPPAVFAAIDTLGRVAALVTERLPAVQLYFDLGELRGYHYHTGLVFAALVSHWGEAVANGGRYDHVGEGFGRARPATGFSTDLKALIALSADETDAERGAVLMPAEEDPALWQLAQQLRGEGERVIQALPGQPRPAGCDRQLERSDHGWRVAPLQ
jgi:ATP phosphoribosyltransferase regulatory subunit